MLGCSPLNLRGPSSGCSLLLCFAKAESLTCSLYCDLLKIFPNSLIKYHCLCSRVVTIRCLGTRKQLWSRTPLNSQLKSIDFSQPDRAQPGWSLISRKVYAEWISPRDPDKQQTMRVHKQWETYYLFFLVIWGMGIAAVPTAVLLQHRPQSTAVSQLLLHRSLNG